MEIEEMEIKNLKELTEALKGILDTQTVETYSRECMSEHDGFKVKGLKDCDCSAFIKNDKLEFNLFCDMNSKSLTPQKIYNIVKALKDAEG